MRQLFLLLFVAHPVIAWNSGKISPTSEKRIVNGTRANIENYPFAVAIFGKINGNWNFMCGGSIANAKFIITAAHCLLVEDSSNEFFPENLMVVVGKDNIKSFTAYFKHFIRSENVREVKTIVVHPDYSFGSSVKDIGLIELKLALKYTKNVLPVDLDDSGIGHWSGSWEARITGFGKTETGYLSDQLMVITPYIRSAWYCFWVFGKSLSYRSNICYTYEEGKGTCFGDSGGGIVVNKGDRKYLLIGIVSSMSKEECGTGVDAGVRVSHFKEWIEDHITLW